MVACNICGNSISTPAYDSGVKSSITSLCKIHPGPTIVYACASCGHVETPEVADIESYYDNSYQILIDSEEEDQVYEVRNGETIFNKTHSLRIWSIPFLSEFHRKTFQKYIRFFSKQTFTRYDKTSKVPSLVKKVI